MLTILSTLILAATVSTVEVQTLDGTIVTGSLTGIAADQVSLDTDEGAVTLAFSQLQKIRFSKNASPASSPAAWVQLVDGTRLVAAEFAVTDQLAQLTALGAQQREFPIRLVRTVRLKQQNEDQRGQWNKIRTTNARSDLIVIRKKNRIDYLEGVLGDVTAEVVNFQLDDEVVPVGRQKVEGLVYYHRAANDQPPATFRVSDIYGSQIEGNEWTVKGQSLSIRTPAGFELERRFDQILQIDFSADKIVYVGDLEPELVRWQPFFSSKQLSESLQKFYRPRVDQAMGGSKSSADDGKLQLWIRRGQSPEVVSYEKGLALHSRTTMAFRLPEEVRYFRALAGIDARVREHGHVRLEILGDGDELFAADISGDDEPLDIAINVSGVRRLTITVDYGDNLDIGDHLNLCNARLIK